MYNTIKLSVIVYNYMIKVGVNTLNFTHSITV